MGFPISFCSDAHLYVHPEDATEARTQVTIKLISDVARDPVMSHTSAREHIGSAINILIFAVRGEML
jgi:hypothetical protein